MTKELSIGLGSSPHKDVANNYLGFISVRSELQKSGKQAIREFLIKMQVSKSLANIEQASKMYLAYSQVSPGSDFARERH